MRWVEFTDISLVSAKRLFRMLVNRLFIGISSSNAFYNWLTDWTTVDDWTSVDDYIDWLNSDRLTGWLTKLTGWLWLTNWRQLRHGSDSCCTNKLGGGLSSTGFHHTSLKRFQTNRFANFVVFARLNYATQVTWLVTVSFCDEEIWAENNRERSPDSADEPKKPSFLFIMISQG